jgi:hypothetical protein
MIIEYTLRVVIHVYLFFRVLFKIGQYSMPPAADNLLDSHDMGLIFAIFGVNLLEFLAQFFITRKAVRT